MYYERIVPTGAHPNLLNEYASIGCNFTVLEALPDGRTVIREELWLINMTIHFSEVTIKLQLFLRSDINREGRVNYKDLFAFAALYGAKWEDINYKVECNFNIDGRIDYKGLFILAMEYGS